jgi:hypothetical protein
MAGRGFLARPRVLGSQFWVFTTGFSLILILVVDVIDK